MHPLAQKGKAKVAESNNASADSGAEPVPSRRLCCNLLLYNKAETCENDQFIKGLGGHWHGAEQRLAAERVDLRVTGAGPGLKVLHKVDDAAQVAPEGQHP